MEEKKLAVIALGGNAILRGNQKGTVEEQNQNIRETLENLIYLVREGYNLIITHGNGPQVGNILMSDDAGVKMYGLPPMTLDMCVAYSQGEIGYMIERNLRNILREHGLTRHVVSMISQIVVDEHDPALQNPTKRVGRRMARSGSIVITGGGGGIPVYVDGEGMLQPLEGVIDKDLASAMIGARVKADELYILTDVPYIYKDFRKPTQEVLEFLDYADTMKYLEAGTFGEGSMAPKIRACLSFVEKGGQKAVITEATKLEDRRYGSKITMHYD